jgi:glyoxylase-like metal-dependent hydrolase (beta-lactamase superfamily II)
MSADQTRACGAATAWEFDPALKLIDVVNQGVQRSIGAWIAHDEIIVDPGPESALDRLLAGLGPDWVPRAIALTHIHLDHAGATGALLERWPNTEVWVHANGAPHLIDPSKLIASASRLYGNDMERLWGRVVPVPAEAIRTPADGQAVGPFTVVDTPGHANHHFAYLHEATGTLFAGDVVGVRIPPSSCVLPPTVPPEFDLIAWQRSIERVRALRPSRLVPTHFGVFDDVDEHLTAISESIGYWALRANELNQAEFVAELTSVVADAGDEGTRAAYALAAQPDVCWMGARRYWEKAAHVR